MFDSIGHVMSSEGFMPHGMCYLWQPGVLSLHVVSDALITLAYFSIPFTLLYFVRKRRDLEFHWMFVCFAIFIVACGTTHAMEIWVIWHPTYWLSGSIKALTALASVPTAVLLVKLIPDALQLPSPSSLQRVNADLEREVMERKHSEADVRRLNEQLERRVVERTQQLETANRELLREANERRSSQQLLQAVIDNSTAVVYVKDLQGRYLLINRRFEELFHVNHDRMIGKTDYDVFPKQHADAFRAVDEQVLVAGTAVQMEEVAPHDDGPHTYISSKCPLNDAEGKVYALCGISTDITERLQSERKQRQQLNQLGLLNRITHAISERQDLDSLLQVAINNLEDNLPLDFGCVLLYDTSGATLAVSNVGVKSHALALELLLTQHTRIPVDQNGLSRCIQGQLVYEADIREVPFPFPQRLVAGGLRSLVATPLQAESKVFGVLVAARMQPDSFSSSDCEFLQQLSEHVGLASHQAQLYTHLQQAYEELRQSQHTILQQERLRALGQMASGVAHDINNAISPIALYTESLLEREPGLSDRARSYLVTIQRAIDDVAQTVSRMREFYRPREPQLTLAPIQLNRIVEQVIELTRVRWSNVPQERGVVIKLNTDLAADLPIVLGVESEIRDALTNLVFNAVDAMSEGGTLTLRTRITTQLPLAIRNASHEVVLEVCDTGAGMDEATRSQCLEPFFTTKGERGTGLGLAMVYGMTQRHSAELSIDSTVGQGTTVSLAFPATSVTAPRTNVLVTTNPPVRSLSILIVDDDPLIIETLCNILQHDGHHVTAANGGQAGMDAFETARQNNTGFEVVITDLGMPYVDGRWVAAAVKATSPLTPVILLTGWGQRLLADNDVPAHVDRVLNKPPKLEQLRRALSDLVMPRPMEPLR